jgi:predicted DNA-binding protein (UPF0251 family)
MYIIQGAINKVIHPSEVEDFKSNEFEATRLTEMEDCQYDEVNATKKRKVSHKVSHK